MEQNILVDHDPSHGHGHTLTHKQALLKGCDPYHNVSPSRASVSKSVPLGAVLLT